MSEILLGQFCIFLTHERCDLFSLCIFTLSQYGFGQYLTIVFISDCLVNIQRGRHFSWVAGSSNLGVSSTGAIARAVVLCCFVLVFFFKFPLTLMNENFLHIFFKGNMTR